MKTRHGFLLLCSLFLMVHGGETTYLNLDFEDINNMNLPKTWTINGRGYHIAVDDQIKHHGAVSLKMEYQKGQGTFANCMKKLPLDDVLGKKVRFTVHIKTQDVTDGRAGMWFRVDGAKERVFDNMQDRGPTGTTDWKVYTVAHVVPADSSGVVIGFLLSGKGTAWFDHVTMEVDGKPYAQVKPPIDHPKPEQLAWLRRHAKPFSSDDPMADHQELMHLKEMVGDSRIVSLGEATHGSAEFFKMKHRMLRFLVEEMGFTIFAIEANMPECRAINDYVLNGNGDPKKALEGIYFWTWNTEEVLALINWMRQYNASGKGPIQFYGYDMQTTRVALKMVKAFVTKVDPDYLNQMEAAEADVLALDKIPYRERRPADFQKAYDAGMKVFQHMETHRDVYVTKEKAEVVDWAIQDARILYQAPSAGLNGKPGRDRSMADNLDWILAHSPKGSKIVSWAHNGHVGRYPQAMGTYVHERHGKDQIIFGFAFHEGTYTAVGDQGINTYGTSDSEPGSFEWYFKSSGHENLILDLRGAKRGDPGSGWLLEDRPFRMIGAVATPFAFSPVTLKDVYDGMIFFSKSTPSKCFRSKAYTAGSNQ